MPARPSTRFGLHAPVGGDFARVPEDLVRLRDQLDAVVLGYDQGELSSRPEAGKQGRLYYATDDGQLYYDFGRGWMPAAWQPGDIRWTAAADSTLPTGWLVADGRAVSRDRYRVLFNRISITYGPGERGGDTFNLPDLRGRVPVGAGGDTIPSRENRSTKELAGKGGEEYHLLTTDEMPNHSHSASIAGSHSHTGWTGIKDITHNHRTQDRRPILTDHSGSATGQYPGLSGTTGNRNIGNGGDGYLTDGGPAHSHSISPDGDHTHTINPTGLSFPHNNMPPYLALNAWIKT